MGLALAAAATAGCDELTPPRIDPFAIGVTLEDGPLRAQAIAAPNDGPFPVLLDTLTPVSVVDTLEPPVAVNPPATRLRTTVNLVATCPAGDTAAGPCEPVVRARFLSASVLDAHPCGDPAAVCSVGVVVNGVGQTAAYRGIVGGDLLSETAMRIDLRDADAPFVELLPDMAGTNGELCRGGDAVVGTPPAGGGTLLIGGAEVAFSGTRIPLGACLGFDPDDPTIPTGTNALLLLATGLGPSVLSQSAYMRYREGTERDVNVPDAPRLATLPEVELHLQSGTVPARQAFIPRLALVGRAGDSVGQCEERRTSQIMSERGSCDGIAACPCSNDRQSCPAGASVQLAPADSIEVLVVADENPTLQALREELRPGQAEVDGLLGITALVGSRFAVDYPNGRTLFRCGDDPACTAITAIAHPGRDTRQSRCP